MAFGLFRAPILPLGTFSATVVLPVASVVASDEYPLIEEPQSPAPLAWMLAGQKPTAIAALAGKPLTLMVTDWFFVYGPLGLILTLAPAASAVETVEMETAANALSAMIIAASGARTRATGLEIDTGDLSIAGVGAQQVGGSVAAR